MPSSLLSKFFRTKHSLPHGTFYMTTLRFSAIGAFISFICDANVTEEQASWIPLSTQSHKVPLDYVSYTPYSKMAAILVFFCLLAN